MLPLKLIICSFWSFQICILLIYIEILCLPMHILYFLISQTKFAFFPSMAKKNTRVCSQFEHCIAMMRLCFKYGVLPFPSHLLTCIIENCRKFSSIFHGKYLIFWVVSEHVYLLYNLCDMKRWVSVSLEPQDLIDFSKLIFR
jgi:hypothetical protein